MDTEGNLDGSSELQRFITVVCDTEAEAKLRCKSLEDELTTVKRIRDFAGPVLQFARENDASIIFDSIRPCISSWEAARDELRGSHINSFASANTAISHTITGFFPVIRPLSASLAPQVSEQTNLALGKVKGVLQRSSIIDDIETACLRLGLDSTSKHRPSSLLIRDAETAMSTDTVTAPLISLRESIQSAIADLVDMYTVGNKPKKSDRISHILGSWGRSHITTSDVDYLCKEITLLLEELSGYKQADLSRGQVSEVFYRGSQLFLSLLQWIDESKFPRR